MSPCTSSAWFGRFVGVVCYVFLNAVFSPVLASEPGCSTHKDMGDSAATDGFDASARQVVSVDPDTGELIASKRPPNAPPVKQRDTGPVQTRELPDGTVIAEVGDRFRAHLVAEIVDGKLVTCHREPAYDHVARDKSEKPDE